MIIPIISGQFIPLGVTPYGGIIINIESLLIPGSGKLILTGNIERTIEESIQVANKLCQI